MNVKSDESLLLLENMWRRRLWEVHMTCERWIVYWGAIFCRLVQYTVGYLPVDDVDVVSSKSFNNRIPSHMNLIIYQVSWDSKVP